MDTTVWYAILSVSAVVIAVVLRFGIYTMLVRFGRWLPEKATKVANIASIAVAVIGLGVVIGKAVITGH